MNQYLTVCLLNDNFTYEIFKKHGLIEFVRSGRLAMGKTNDSLCIAP